MAAYTGTGKDSHTAYLTVTWTSPMVKDVNWWITASTNGGAEQEIWRGPMDSTGSYSLTYELRQGTTTFRVRSKDYWDWYPPGYSEATQSR